MKSSIKLHTETFGQGESLCLIHGWGAQNAVWRDWAETYLAPHFEVTLIELPGFGASPKLELQDGSDLNQAWLDSVADVLPSKTHLLGWSLGGLIAQQLAQAYPERINRLICLASTPCFVQAGNWKWAVSPELMSNFIKALGLDSWGLLSRFWKLQLQGSDGARQLIKHYTSQMKTRNLPSFAGLLQGLELLRDIDMRQKLVLIQAPTLWLLGEKDPLVPPEIIKQLPVLQPKAKIEMVQGAAHIPFFSHPEQTAHQINTFLLGEVHG
ncbi:pimeloyl-ACP methyl ester esterase BioH [Thiomicrospira sp.]|uniref:pimeloyl-ACP methyl ester esterase BioH n=1 Tax=Thiomicrospira sp. TaxID=935 RepID=UPI002F930897